MDVILQKHLRLVVHLVVNVLQKQTADESDAGKSDG